MDFKKKSWIEENRRNWPDRSLEKSLVRDYPGCKSAFEAVQKVLSKEKPIQDQPALQPHQRITKPTNEDYLVMKQAILDIEIALKGIDLSKLPKETREQIAKMPITQASEALDWKAAWLKALGELSGKANR